jgi:hypothetical protein
MRHGTRRSKRVGCAWGARSVLEAAFEKIAGAQLAGLGGVLESRLAQTVQRAAGVGVRERTRALWARRARLRGLVSEEPHAACQTVQRLELAGGWGRAAEEQREHLNEHPETHA